MSPAVSGFSVIGYNPNGLHYRLIREEGARYRHPKDPAGLSTPVVGVHKVLSTGPWESNLSGIDAGALYWHEVPLSAWTGTRRDFANATTEEQKQAMSVGPAFADAKWETHLGATLTAISRDGKAIVRSRSGKYAEESLWDSLIAGTMSVADSVGLQSTSEYFRALLAQANISMQRDVLAICPTHLAIRPDDFGLWLGGFVLLAIDADDIARQAPFATCSFDLNDESPVPLTSWGDFDLNAARVHRNGGTIVESTLLP